MNNESIKRPEALAIIPARGGSKGIPRKNIRELAGKPLIMHTIEAALNSGVLDRVVVSTEDSEIAGLVRGYGVEVIDRPQELATDTAATEPVLEHAITFLEKQENYWPDIIVLLQATSPLRQSQHIKGAMAEFLSSSFDSLLSVCLSHVFIWRIRGNGAEPLNYDYRQRPMKQDMPQEFRENGAIYIFRKEILREHHSRLGGKTGLYVMSEEDSLEIDSEYDFWLCQQAMLKKRV